MAKGLGKKAYHKQDMDKLNRVALVIGGAVAVVILFLMVLSFVTQ